VKLFSPAFKVMAQWWSKVWWQTVEMDIYMYGFPRRKCPNFRKLLSDFSEKY
jgi:hypothetical protein